MSEILISRQSPGPITEADREVVRRVVFGQLDGIGDTYRRSWRRLWNRLLKLEPGEIVELRTHQERLGWYHRKHMKLESRVFDEQERFDQFRAFRTWLKVGSGFVDWYPGPKGGVIPVPRSISYAELEQGEMEKVHADMVAFLRTDHALKTLWPKAPLDHSRGAMELILDGEFQEP